MPVVVSGSGIACALGKTVTSAADNMLVSSIEVSKTVIDDLHGFGGAVSIPFYAIDSSFDNATIERFQDTINTVVSESLAGVALSQGEQSRMGLFVGSSSFEIGPSEIRYRQELAAQGFELAMPMQLVSLGHLSGQLRRHFQIDGPDFVFGTACSASANAILSATRLLQQRRIDHALVVGVELHNVTTLAGFQSLQLIAEDRVQPFDKNRSGMILGEACAAVVLSRNDVDTEGLVLKGGASSCDISSVTATSSDGDAIARVIHRALADSGLAAGEIHSIKAHGTASQANDFAEAAGLRRVFESLPPVFSLKSYIGHTLGACGVAELVLLDAALNRGLLPATVGFEQSDPALAVEPTTMTRRVHRGENHLLNYFGFGGNNTVLVVEYG